MTTKIVVTFARKTAVGESEDTRFVRTFVLIARKGAPINQLPHSPRKESRTQTLQGHVNKSTKKADA